MKRVKHVPPIGRMRRVPNSAEAVALDYSCLSYRAEIFRIIRTFQDTRRGSKGVMWEVKRRFPDMPSNILQNHIGKLLELIGEDKNES